MIAGKRRATREGGDKGGDRADRARARCVASVARALNRAAASPYAEEDGVPVCVASMIIHGNSGEEFLGWPHEAARAIAMAYALHAPDDMVAWLTTNADRQYAWCEWWDAPGGGRYQGGTIEKQQDRQLTGRADKLLAMRPAPAGLAVAS